MAKPHVLNLKSAARRAMGYYGFEADFPKSVWDEILAIGSNTSVDVKEGVKDLRNLLWSSIDNDDSQDLDQIEYCEKGESGEILVKVAIADVDIYAPKGSSLDKYALNNTTSIYAGVETFPLFPDHLSTDLSSLAVDEDRFAIVAEFTVLPNGLVRPQGVYQAIVNNKAKLVYEEIGAWLEGKKPLPPQVENTSGLEAQLRLQNMASQILGGSRFDRGALELESIEAKVITKDENVLDLVLVEADMAKSIIENFMIAANGVISGFLEDVGIPIIQRVVRIPKNWNGIVDVARSKGTRLPAQPDAKALSAFLIKQKTADPERFPDLSLTMVKLLGAGEYVFSEKHKPHVGHFCLAVTDYTHATAPNRRYVDLIIQRLLKAALKGSPPPYGKKELTEIAARCTDREKASKKVERFMKKVAAAALLVGRIGERFDGIITGASEKGTYVRIIKPPTEGRVMHNTRGLKVGQKVMVKLINLDPSKGYIDFERAR